MVPEQPADVVKGQGQEHVLEQGIDQENKLVLEQPAHVKARNIFWNRE
jgi:hypothetical protein